MSEYTVPAAVTRTRLAKALLEFQRHAPDLHTDSSGNFNNKYIGLPGLMDAIREPLAAQGLVLIQKPTILENGAPGLVTKLLHESGEEEQSVMPLLLDKQNPQGLGSALTYARRQAALAFLGLAPDDDDDAHAASNGGEAKPAAKPEPPTDNLLTEKQGKKIYALLRKLNFTEADVLKVYNHRVSGLSKAQADDLIKRLMAKEAKLANAEPGEPVDTSFEPAPAFEPAEDLVEADIPF